MQSFRLIIQIIFLVSSLLLLCPFSSFAQEEGPELVYGCENCKVTSYLPMGEYKLLLFSNDRNFLRRKLYLLDKQNLIVDEMKVESSSHLVRLSEHTFSVLEISMGIIIEIQNGRLQVKEAYDLYDRPRIIQTAHMFLTPYHLFGMTPIAGAGENDARYVLYSINRPLMPQVNPRRMGYYGYYRMRENPPFHYTDISYADTVTIFRPKGPPLEPSESFYIKFWYAQDIAYSWLPDYKTLIAIHADNAKQISKFNSYGKETEMLAYIDYTRGDSYMLTWDPKIKEGRTYTLHEVQKNKTLKPVYRLQFKPMLIDDGYAYQSRVGERRFDLYRHALKGQLREKMQDFGAVSVGAAQNL